MDELSNNNSNNDVITILIATDNHLGYMERDPLRSNDSFQTFEEILLYAKKYNVDMMLLGGDLFHDNKPSRKTLYNTIALLRQHCMGDKPCQLEFLSDQKKNFTSFFPIVNYEDPNLNISLPIFSIHGNHDDPSGNGNLCALDILSASGLINYFGKSNQVDNIEISPILLKKGNTRLALYGLGNIRDERLYRTYLRKNVKMLRPKQNMDEWFNIFVLHQNRVSHNPKNYIPETFINDFIDLILWGHEHECLIDLNKNEIKNFYITQPGSSIATSLCEGESKTKHIGILRIKQKQFEIEKIKLKSVRPFLMMDICLQEDLNDERDPSTVTNYLIQKVEELEEKAIDEWKKDNPELATKMNCPRPLIRLRVEYSGGYPTFNPHKFGQRFVNRIANPNDILHFYRKKTVVRHHISSENDVTFLPEKLENSKIETLIDEFLQIKNLDILNEKELGNAVKSYIEKDEKDSIKEYVDKYLNDICKEVKTQYNPSDVNLLNDQIQTIRNIKKEKYNSVDNSLNIFSNVNSNNKENTSDMEIDNEQISSESSRKTNTRRKRQNKDKEGDEDDDEDNIFNMNVGDDADVVTEEEEEEEEEELKKRGRRQKKSQKSKNDDIELLNIDGYDDNESEITEKISTRKKNRKKNISIVDNDENDNKLKEKQNTRKRNRKTKTNQKSNEENDKSEKVTAKKQGKKVKNSSNIDENDDYNDSEVPETESNKKRKQKEEEEEDLFKFVDDIDDDMIDILNLTKDNQNDKDMVNINTVVQVDNDFNDRTNAEENSRNKTKKEPKTPKRGTKRKLEDITSTNLEEQNTTIYDSDISHIDMNNTIKNKETETKVGRKIRKLPSSFGQSQPVKRVRRSKSATSKELHQSQLNFSIKPKK